MSTLTTYNGLQIATPAPTGYGGNAVNNNFKALATRIDTADPTTGADSTQGFSAGSRWYNSSSGNEWICLSAAPGAASWAVITGVLGDYLPLSGGTLTGQLNIVADGDSFVGQLHIQPSNGADPTNRHLYIGYDGPNNYAYIRSFELGSGDNPLLLQPTGGGCVAMNTTSPNEPYYSGVCQCYSETEGIGGAYPALAVINNTTARAQMGLGVDNTSNDAFIQCLHLGVALTQLYLNPQGGNVILGGTAGGAGAVKLGTTFDAAGFAMSLSGGNLNGNDGGGAGGGIWNLDGALLKGIKSAPPGSSSDTGTAGTITWDSNYLYVCIATNAWVRTALSW